MSEKRNMKCQGCGCHVTQEQADSAPRVTGFTTLCETCAEGLGPEKVPPDGSHHEVPFEVTPPAGIAD